MTSATIRAAPLERGRLPVRDLTACAGTAIVSLENRKARGFGHERRGEILAAARTLFLEHGVEKVSTRQVAARVGISQTSLYVYFKSKEEMLDAAVEAAFGTLGAAFRALQLPSDPVATLRMAIEGYIRFGLASPDEYRLAFVLRRKRSSASDTDDRRRAIGIRVFAVLEGLVANAIADGGARPSDARCRAAAQVLWASIHGLVALLLATPDFGWEPLDTLIGVQADILLQGVMARAPLTAPRKPRHRTSPPGAAGHDLDRTRS